MDRRDLLNGVNDFLSDSIVLPPGDFDKDLLLPIIETARMKKMKTKRHSSRIPSQNQDRLTESYQQTQAQLSVLSREKQDEDPFQRSGFVFGGVFREMRRRYDHYKSDFLDAFSLNCFVSLIFMFIACLAPALTFGGIIGTRRKTFLKEKKMKVFCFVFFL